jgi:hypothetical protein
MRQLKKIALNYAEFVKLAKRKEKAAIIRLLKGEPTFCCRQSIPHRKP